MRWSSAAKTPLAEPRCQGRLADEQTGVGRGAVHLGVRQQSQLLELLGREQVGLVDQEHHLSVPLGLLGGEQVRHLRDRLRLVEPGCRPERGGDRDVEPATASRGVGDVDDRVAGPVEAGHRGTHRDGLSGTDVAGDHPEGGLRDAVLDAGDRLLVGATLEQPVGGDRLRERRAGEAEVRSPQPSRRAHRASSSVSAPKPGSSSSR